MDITVLVGFAASGPLNRPVAVEDVAQFESIFGADIPLAWDSTRGEMVYGYLAPAVRAFFRNGGRRCWIVRVARQPGAGQVTAPLSAGAESNYFAIPGLLRAVFDDNGRLSQLAPAFAPARSEGSWSDRLRVGAALIVDPLVAQITSYNPLRLILSSSLNLVVGDLLRLTFREDGYQLICAIDSIVPATPSPLATGPQVQVTIAKQVWLQASWAKSPASGIAEVTRFRHDGESAPLPASIPLRLDDPTSPPLPFDWAVSEQVPTVKFNLDEALEAAP